MPFVKRPMPPMTPEEKAWFEWVFKRMLAAWFVFLVSFPFVMAWLERREKNKKRLAQSTPPVAGTADGSQIAGESKER